MSLNEYNEYNDYDEYTPLSTEDVLDNTVSSESSDDSLIAVTQPNDRYNFVCITFAILGLAQLLPYNFLITATDYWMYKFRDVNQTSSDKTELQKFFDSYLTIASNFPLLVVLVLNAVYGYKVREEIRNVVSFSGIIIFFIITTIFVKANTDSYQINFFYFTMFCVVVMSAFAALLQGSISGLVSVFPSRCMHAMVTGQGTAGLFAVFAQLLTIVGQWGPIESAFCYFIFADIILIVTFVMYCLIYRTIWQHGMSVLMVFWVTIALFPPITVLIVPDKTIISEKYFLPIFCFLLFNLSDFLSRLTARCLPLPLNRRYLLLSLASLRFILIPLIMLCNIHPRSHLPVLFNSEAYYILFIILLGFSNGYVFGNAMINGPMRVSDQYKENAGFILVAFLGIGLTLGAFSSNLLIRFL